MTFRATMSSDDWRDHRKMREAAASCLVGIAVGNYDLAYSGEIRFHVIASRLAGRGYPAPTLIEAAQAVKS